MRLVLGCLCSAEALSSFLPFIHLLRVLDNLINKVLCAHNIMVVLKLICPAIQFQIELYFMGPL